MASKHARTGLSILLMVLSFGLFGIIPRGVHAEDGGAHGPIFFGDDTPLRRVLREDTYSRINESYIWTKDKTAWIVLLFPRASLLTATDYPGKMPPWWPAGIDRRYLDPEFKNKSMVSDSGFILVFREEDGKNCVINSIRGERLYSESVPEQGKTAIKILCSEFRTLAEAKGLSDGDVEAIERLLRTPPRPVTKR